MSKLLDIVHAHGGTLHIDGVEFTGRKKGRAPAPNQTSLSFPSLEAYAGAMTTALTSSDLADRERNRDLLKDIGSDDRKRFAGGLLSELMPDALPFYAGLEDVETARSRIASSLSFQEFEASLAQLGMKRRRFFSEYDGEYLEDRALEIAPFLATKRQAAPIRVINLVAQFSVSAYVEASSIQEYGASIAALVSVLEGAGILCGVSIERRSSSVWERKTGNGELSVTVGVKRPDEFLPPASIAAAVSSNCYRRLGIGASPLVSDIIGRDVRPGCGNPNAKETSWDSETGVLNISAKEYFSGNASATDEIICLLKQALGLAPATHAA